MLLLSFAGLVLERVACRYARLGAHYERHGERAANLLSHSPGFPPHSSMNCEQGLTSLMSGDIFDVEVAMPAFTLPGAPP